LDGVDAGDELGSIVASRTTTAVNVSSTIGARSLPVVQLLTHEQVPAKTLAGAGPKVLAPVDDTVTAQHRALQNTEYRTPTSDVGSGPGHLLE
jgi:hypothetical protein